ncbi:MAG: efflux RND transporter periplasmic adaptor subunit, partial [Thermoleophilia bacterium]|nr:efflux RND transporter periplasmic adaptor subunit [Thermoleophilia bacterium]
RARATVDLRARVEGYLERLNFQDGAIINEGELLFVIEKAPYEAKVDAARAEVRRAEAALQLAETELSRSRNLIQRNAAPPQELDVKVAERDSASAAVAAAKAALREAELMLGYTEIRAPISGRIGRHLVDVGNIVRPDQTSLATIESYDPIHVYFTMSESDLLFLTGLQGNTGGAAPHDRGLKVEMGLGEREGFPYEGKLDFAELGVDPGTGTVEYRAVFPNADRKLVPGLFARLRTAVSEATPRVLVPERAVGSDQRGEYVLVVADDKTVVYTPVRLGRPAGGLRVVDQGLKGDEWVIVNGVQRARPGTKVDPKRTESVAVRPGDFSVTGAPAPASTPAVGSPVASRLP